MLSATQRAFYEENGYLKVENMVTQEQLAELRCAGGGTMKVGNLSAQRDFLHVDYP